MGTWSKIKTSIRKTHFINKIPDQVETTLHSALTASYGSYCRWVLNRLTSALRKTASASCALRFLILCWRFHVMPKFASAAVSFSQRGPCLCRLADRLLLRILLASIRDQRLFLMRAQAEVDSLWRRIETIISNVHHWNCLVAQKDEFFIQCCSKQTESLRRKFSALFAAKWRPDTSYYRTPDQHTVGREPQERVEERKGNGAKLRPDDSDSWSRTSYRRTQSGGEGRPWGANGQSTDSGSRTFYSPGSGKGRPLGTEENGQSTASGSHTFYSPDSGKGRPLGTEAKVDEE